MCTMGPRDTTFANNKKQLPGSDMLARWLRLISRELVSNGANKFSREQNLSFKRVAFVSKRPGPRWGLSQTSP